MLRSLSPEKVDRHESDPAHDTALHSRWYGDWCSHYRWAGRRAGNQPPSCVRHDDSDDGIDVRSVVLDVQLVALDLVVLGVRLVVGNLRRQLVHARAVGHCRWQWRRDRQQYARLMSQSTVAARFAAIGTHCTVLVTDRFAALRAAEIALHEVSELDRVASRFRVDSELMQLPKDGLPHRISALLGDVVEASLRTAALTDGLVDPTVGGALIAWGYDEDLDVIQGRTEHRSRRIRPLHTWRAIRYDARLQLLAIPTDCTLDFGASAKAFLADRLAARIHEDTGSGVLVDLGGDIATAGPLPDPGWRIGVELPSGEVLQTVVGSGQAFATSSTALRTWRSDGELRHHIIDPRTMRPAEVVWQQVTVAGSTVLQANSASTAAIILGDDAPNWLTERGLPALLVDVDGAVRHTDGWPARGVA